MIGVVFSDESEAKTFYKKVSSKKTDAGAPLAHYTPAFLLTVSAGKSKSDGAKKKKASKPSKGGKIDKSMISGPTAGSFKHVAHMGYDSERGFTSTNVDPSWENFLTNLEGFRVNRVRMDELFPQGETRFEWR